ncbi:hypothetical protein HPSA20_1515 [Helicobacter pylori SouthAfrica20]|uniref:Uncharacterized protein n=1 Tax=Helicobacter pylori SouthAfrica20 TaxID=1352356 RepID=T1UE26_HELPX|nr:hypothetical protein HPSA20_1515 [Helicobacter pylori SouthAfrica20]
MFSLFGRNKSQKSLESYLRCRIQQNNNAIKPRRKAELNPAYSPVLPCPSLLA